MSLGYMQRDIVTGSYDPYTQLGVMFFQRIMDSPLQDRRRHDAYSGARRERKALPYAGRHSGRGCTAIAKRFVEPGVPVEVTSTYDAATAEAVRAFQTQRGAEATGIVDAYLRQIIANESALNGTFIEETNPSGGYDKRWTADAGKAVFAGPRGRMRSTARASYTTA